MLGVRETLRCHKKVGRRDGLSVTIKHRSQIGAGRLKGSREAFGARGGGRMVQGPEACALDGRWKFLRSTEGQKDDKTLLDNVKARRCPKV